MKKIHRITGIVISVFIVAHLYNHLSAIWGIAVHQSTLESLRTFYRIPIIEIILVGSFLFQSVSGILLFFKLRKKPSKSTLDKLKMYSGLILGLFLIQHIPATIGQRFYFEFDTNFYFAARVVLEAPLLYYFIPYYFAGIIAFAVHIGSIHREKIQAFVGERQASLHFFIILSLFFILALIILYTFTGGFYDIQIPTQYHVY